MKLGACIDGKATAGRSGKRKSPKRRRWTSGTPTMFVNGRRIPQTIDWPNLKTMIDTKSNTRRPPRTPATIAAAKSNWTLPGPPTPATGGRLKKKVNE